MKLYKSKKTRDSHGLWRNLVSIAMSASLFGATTAFAQEQFFFSDDAQSPAIASTPDGKTKFVVYGALAVTEGDIVLGNAFNLIHGKETPRSLNRGLARTTKLDRWIDGILYYEITENIAPAEVEKIMQAVQHWNDNTSVTLTERTAEHADSVPDYIEFVTGPGCGSYVGRVGSGPQALWVNSKCSAGSIIHELGHAAGLFHEHTRADRDNFISVIWDNIDEETKFNFDIVEDGIETILDYDYASVMHYGSTFFSINGNPTISVPDGVQIGQREHLSITDIASVDSLYATDLSLSTTKTTGDQPNDVILDIIASNIGALGANTVRYSLTLNPGDTASGYSGANWSCSSAGNALTCERETLPQGATASLAIKLTVATTPDQELSDGFLSSKTLDTDLSNNGLMPADSPDSTPTEAPNTSPGTLTSEPLPDTTPTTPITPTTPTTPITPDEPATPAVVEPEALPAIASATPAASGGGSISWWILASILSVGLTRRRRLDSEN